MQVICVIFSKLQQRFVPNTSVNLLYILFKRTLKSHLCIAMYSQQQCTSPKGQLQQRVVVATNPGPRDPGGS